MVYGTEAKIKYFKRSKTIRELGYHKLNFNYFKRSKTIRESGYHKLNINYFKRSKTIRESGYHKLRKCNNLVTQVHSILPI